MKTHLAILIVVLVAITNSVFASPSTNKTAPINPKPTPEQEEVRLGNFLVNVFNSTDRPPTLPFLTISFNVVPDTAIESIITWRDEIDQKLQKLGGVLVDKDYSSKISPIIAEYVNKFLSVGAKSVFISFPRKKLGILLTPKK